MDIDTLRAEIVDLAKIYKRAACDGFSQCDDIEQALEMYESFYVLSALGKPWADCAHFKCICEGCMKCCICHHSLILSILCNPEMPNGHTVPAQYLADGVPDKRKRGCPAQRASDSKTLDGDDEEPARDKQRKVSMFAIFTQNVSFLTVMHSGGLAATVYPSIQDSCRSIREDMQG
jgi:hypothetical protein